MKRKYFMLFLFLLFPMQLLFAQSTIKAYVRDTIKSKALYNASVYLEELNVKTTTDFVGYFSFKKVPKGNYTLKIEAYGHDAYEQKIEVGEERVDLGKIYLNYNPSNTEILPLIFENDLLIDESNSQLSFALLQSSKDVFQRTAAFEWGNFWFRPRGMTSNHQIFQFNGVPFRDAEDGQVKYNNFSGLNEITRNPAENAFGIHPTDYSFGALGGFTEISTQPSQYKKGFKAGYIFANRTYNNRVSLAYHSGLNKNGWAFSLVGTRTWAKEGVIDGTFYDGWAYFLAIEKKTNAFNSVYFTLFGAPINRAGGSSNTLEVYRLAGKNYNSLWGWQDGKKRNERVTTLHEPLMMITHLWTPKENTRLKTTVSYQFGGNGITRLQSYSPEDATDYTQSASPSYYKYLPSYGNTTAEQWLSQNQINWEDIYAKNLVSGVAKYALFRDRQKSNTLTANSQFKKIFSDQFTLTSALIYQRTMANYFKEVADLLGANFVESKDQFNDYQKFNIDHVNTAFYVGDKVEYNYRMTHHSTNLFTNAHWKNKKWLFHLGLNFNETHFLREGLFRHYNFEETNLSKGKSNRQSFLTMGIKANGQFQINGKNFLQFNIAQSSNPPTTDQVFPTARENNITNPNANPLKVFASDLNYLYRNTKLNAKASVYFNYLQDDIAISRYFTQGIIGDVLLTEVLTGINKKYLGTELSAEYKYNASWSFSAVASIGQFTYDNNPQLLTYDVNHLYKNLGNAYIKNNKIAGTPQHAYSIGAKYQSPKFWWAGISANYFMRNYANFAYLLRTQSFVDSAPFQPNPNEVSDLLKQEEFDGQFILNLNMGKSFRFGDYSLTIYGAVNNVLNNRNYITSGFEQARLTDYIAFREDKTSGSPIFGTRYWFDFGATYYLTISLRF